MHKLYRLILPIVIFNLASTTAATTTINCPPVEMVRAATFKWVVPQRENLWLFIAENINFESNDWTVRFSTYLPRDTNPDNILRYGQKLFSLYPIYFSHLNDNTRGVIYCEYSSDHTVHAMHLL